MTLETLAQKTLSTVIVDNPGAEISAAYSSDLLSDVMGHCGDESALITIQNHLNTIAVCTLVGVEAIVICHGRPIPPDMKEAAEREGVAILSSPLSQFAASVALAELTPSAK
jgi:serine kinase of HPr protein (carbohydrate metabolism regulator)